MKYIDMHCDTLTECANKNLELSVCNLQTDFNKLRISECAAQCFAVFTEGENSAEKFKGYINFYLQSIIKNSGTVLPVLCCDDLIKTLNGEKLGCILTVENLGFAGKNLSELQSLKAAGVKMASLVWNYENALAYPNVIFRDGVQMLSERQEKGLKKEGLEAVEALDSLRIIVDISHLSDGGAEQILTGRKIPVVASHSNAWEVCGVSRNLTDGLIKKIADCGGVIGVNFYSGFVGGDNIFEGLVRHIKHIVNTGGEEVVAIGSDFDGIPASCGLEDCTKMPELFDFLNAVGLNSTLLEKMAYGNFLRVFGQVCG